MQAASPIELTNDPAWVVPATRRTRRYLRCLRCPRDVVDDLVQETLLAAVRTWSEAEPPLPWLFATARNFWFQHCRAHRRTALLVELPHLHEQAARELAEDGGDWRLQALAACVANLPPHAQLALRLAFREGLSRPEMAERLGLSVAGIKGLLRRTKVALSKCVQRRKNNDA